MADLIVDCPRCGEKITLSEAITRQLQEEVRSGVEARTRKTYEKKLETEMARLKEKTDRDRFDLQEQLKEKQEKLEEFRQQERDLRKQKRKLEEKQKEIDLEIARQVDAAKQETEQKVADRLAKENRLKNREKDEQLERLRRQIEELKRKAEQGSQQLQGEVAELDLEETLALTFPLDQIEPVPPGVSGADVIQRVHNRTGQSCGTIIWEFKNTKHWYDDWLVKLKDDQRAAKADLAVLVSVQLPDTIKHFAQVDGVWVAGFPYALGLATALRQNLIQVARVQQASVGKNEKMEILYNYLSGTEFRQRVEAIVEAFITMQNELEREKRVIKRQWAKREKEIQRVIGSVSGMYGDMQGIIGASLPRIEHLEFPELPGTVES